MSADHYLTLAGESTAMLREKASQFIGIVVPIQNEDDFKIELQRIVTDHPGARHFCFAYILGEDGDVYNAPTMLANHPERRASRSCAHLQGAGLTFSAVVVVRYFGGTLLGKGRAGAGLR